MNQRFAKAVLRMRPDLAVTEAFFYYAPAGSVLCGFVYEKIHEHTRISKYALPLYDRVEFLSLLFPERLPHPHESVWHERWSPVKAAADFLGRIEPYEEEVRRLREPKAFLEHFESWIPSNQPRQARALAFTDVLLGNRQRARHQLEQVLQLDLIQEDPEFVADTQTIYDALDSAGDTAPALLREWERQTKAQYQIR